MKNKKKKKKNKNKNKNKNKKNNNKKKKRAPDPPEYLRPNSFVPPSPKGTHAGGGSLTSEKMSLPTPTAKDPSLLSSM